MNTLVLLDEYTDVIFRNQDKFIEHFFNYEVYELIDVWFNSTRVKIYFLLECGQHVTDDISFNEFLKWYEVSK